MTVRGIFRRISVLGALITLSVIGCGKSGAEPGGDASAGVPDGTFTTCDSDKRAVPYQPGVLTARSSGGTFSLTLLESVPGPPVKGQNRWTVEVDDVITGAPQDGLDISVMPWMPDHAHGTTPVVVTASGPGTYLLQPLYLFMAALWEIRFDIVAARGSSAAIQETAMIPVCIP